MKDTKTQKALGARRIPTPAEVAQAAEAADDRRYEAGLDRNEEAADDRRAAAETAAIETAPTFTLSADNELDRRDFFLMVEAARMAVDTDPDRLALLQVTHREFDAWEEAHREEPAPHKLVAPVEE